MWNKIIEIIINKLLEQRTPSVRLSKAVVRLYRSMVDCHSAYLKFRKETAPGLETWREARNADTDEFDARWEYWEHTFAVADDWAKAIETLALTLYDLRELIGIFDPEVFKIIDKYVEHESYACGFVKNRLKTQPEFVEGEVVLLAGFIGRSLPESKVADPESAAINQERDAADFGVAIDRLRTFIQDQLKLKPEDIYRVL